MTENNKPEWFEIVEADGPVTPPKASKTLPIAAVMVTALILGIGAVVGQVGQESPATATQGTPTQDMATPTDSVSSAAMSPAAPVVAATTARLANPSIAMLPTNGDDEDDDDYEDDEDDEYEDEEDDD
jgi:hypothetical protein